MKTLNTLHTSAFQNCAINEFDAPILNSIIVDTGYRVENLTITIGKKNF